VADFRSESVAAFRRNGWPTCVGISGRLGSEYALGTLNLLKSLTWPSTLPVIALPSAFFGSQQVDFNQWAWLFTVLRTLVIATASIAAYRIIFVGGGQTT